MLSDRNYLVKQEDLKMPFEEFRDKYQNQIDTNSVRREEMTILAKSKLDPSDKILVFFLEGNGDKNVKKKFTKKN